MSKLDEILFEIIPPNYAYGKSVAESRDLSVPKRAEAKAAIVKLMLDVIGEDDGWKQLNLGDGPTLEEFKAYVGGRNELRATQRGAVAKLEDGDE